MTLSQLVPGLHRVGKELHGPCPFCAAGEDRFVVWPEEGRGELGRYWCRQCESQGDAIDYLRHTEGLSYEEALQKLGLPNDEYIAPKPVIGSNGVAAGETYDYTDEQGQLLFQVQRGPGKKFRQRVPTENGWTYQVKGVRRVLYRLGGVLKAIAENKAVFFVEGEKDVHTIESMNLAATTSPQGSAAWQDAYAEELKGVREVVLVPDRDRPGLKYMAAVAESLTKRQIPFRVIHLDYPLQERGGKDITDWLTDRNVSLSQARDELIAMYQGAKDRVYAEDRPYPRPYTLEELMAKQFKDPEWVVPGVLPWGVTLLVAKPKVGKTFLGLSIAYALTAGVPALGSIESKTGPVLYLAFEDRERGLRLRMSHIMKLGGKLEGRLMIRHSWPNPDEGGLEHIEQFLQDYPATRLVVIDTLKMMRPPSVSRKGIYDQDYEAIYPFTRIAERCDTSFLIVHHASKARDIDDPADLASGSTGLTGAAENIMVMRRSTSHEGVDLWMRGRDAEETEIALTFDTETLSWRHAGDAREFSMSEQRKKILDVMRAENGPVGPKEVADASGVGYDTTRTLMVRMVNDEEKTLIRRGRGQYEINPVYEWSRVGKDEPNPNMRLIKKEDNERPF